MADNTTLNAGSGGDVIGSDDIAGVKYQRVKLIVGADGTNDGDVATANPMPVTIRGGNVAHDAADSGNPVKIGTIVYTGIATGLLHNDRSDCRSDEAGRLLTTHINHNAQISKTLNYTTSQTGVALWTPATGKKIAITHLIVSTYATTSARVIIWFGGSADTTYTAGTDQGVLIASYAPSTSSKPGTVLQPTIPIFAATADHVLRLTTDANISIDIIVYGYEI